MLSNIGPGSRGRLLGHFQTPILQWINFCLAATRPRPSPIDRLNRKGNSSTISGKSRRKLNWSSTKSCICCSFARMTQDRPLSPPIRDQNQAVNLQAYGRHESVLDRQRLDNLLFVMVVGGGWMWWWAVANSVLATNYSDFFCLALGELWWKCWRWSLVQCFQEDKFLTLSSWASLRVPTCV